MKKGFIIKGIYLTGSHIGREFYLKKGGYVTECCNIYFESDTYKNYGVAERRCRQLVDDNVLNYDIETYMKDGKITYVKVYNQIVYVPVEVSVVEGI